MREAVWVVGGGLAGCEAAWQLARRGVRVRLCEMRPGRRTPAHETGWLGELTGSTTFRSEDRARAVGLLHEEMRRMGSLVFEVAERHRLPAGRALAVDPEGFAQGMNERIEGEPQIDLVREEIERIPEGIAILAVGPHVGGPLAEALGGVCGRLLCRLHFRPAVVRRDSLHSEHVFEGPAEDPASAGTLYVPLGRELYERFVEEIRLAERTPLQPAESRPALEENLPIEEVALRGRQVLRLGGMKSAGRVDPRTGQTPYAVLPLRQEDAAGTRYCVEGFRTRMRVAEQRRILRMLPGLEKVEFARFGSVHRHVFVRTPGGLDARLQARERPGLLLAGRVLGVEGNSESAALGLMAGVHAAFLSRGERAPLPPATTALGALARGLTEGIGVQPAALSYGMFPPLEATRPRLRRRERGLRMSERALADLTEYARAVGGPG